MNLATTSNQYLSFAYYHYTNGNVFGVAAYSFYYVWIAGDVGVDLFGYIG